MSYVYITGEALGEKKITKPGNKFNAAVKTMKKFKTAVVAVKAVNRFRRSPLNTILKMPQEQAIQIVVENNTENIGKEKKTLHHCHSVKVAKRCVSDRHDRYEEQFKTIKENMIHEEEETQKRELLRSTFGHLIGQPK